VGTLRICTGCAANAGNLAAFDYVILHAWERNRIPALKAANPRVKVLVYKDMAATYSYAVHNGRDDALLPAGVGYVSARDSHPDWFARDTAGNPIEFVDYDDLWLMDVGNHAYQQAWLASVGAELRRDGWDGVMIDDANASPRWHTGNRTIARYPNDAAWAAATKAFLARVGPALKQGGFLVLPNIYTDWPSGPQVWQDWLQYTSGGVQEYWTKWGTGTDQQFSGADWTYRQQFLSLTEALGKIYLGITYAPLSDVRSQRYARASFLLDWDGSSSALVFEPTGRAQPAFAPEWTADIGRPAAPRVQVAAGVWKREYTDGLALVNTARRAAQTVDLGGSYLTPEGMPVTSLTLEPTTGIVLHRPPGAPSANPQKARNPKADKNRRLTGFALSANPVSGQLPGDAAARARVTIYWCADEHWHLFARVRADRHGRFRVDRPIRAASPIHLRAVARIGAYVARSRILLVQ
jgi:hypothetical protein